MKYKASDGSLWNVTDECPPIPTCSMDWAWVSDEYDGPGDDRHGHEPTMDDAIVAIEAYISERDEL